MLVGAGQLSQRDRGLTLSPLDLIVRSARLMGETPGAGRLLGRTESVRIVDCLSWPVPDPGALVARELGLEPAETVRTLTSGTGR
jgi:acetyl-CoA C-acetyltransferase